MTLQIFQCVPQKNYLLSPALNPPFVVSSKKPSVYSKNDRSGRRELYAINSTKPTGKSLVKTRQSISGNTLGTYGHLAPGVTPSPNSALTPDKIRAVDITRLSCSSSTLNPATTAISLPLKRRTRETPTSLTAEALPLTVNSTKYATSPTLLSSQSSPLAPSATNAT